VEYDALTAVECSWQDVPAIHINPINAMARDIYLRWNRCNETKAHGEKALDTERC
jgi:hypothetical protein